MNVDSIANELRDPFSIMFSNVVSMSMDRHDKVLFLLQVESLKLLVSCD